MTKAATSRGTVFPLGKDNKISAPERTPGQAQQIQNTPEQTHFILGN
jgi:hypothetical protein